MKKLLYPLFTLLILFTVGCGDDDATDADPLVGVWEMKTVLMVFEDIGEGSPTITFNSDADNNETMILVEDGTYSSSGVSALGAPPIGSFSKSGSWSATSNKLTIIEDGETKIFDFSISGRTLTLMRSDTYSDYLMEEDMIITITYKKS